jgi:hypothetical protein
MTDKEQRAHDIAVAIASCLEQAKHNATIAANLKLGNSELAINADTDTFIQAYNMAYAKALSALEQ